MSENLNSLKALQKEKPCHYSLCYATGKACICFIYPCYKHPLATSKQMLGQKWMQELGKQKGLYTNT